MYRETNISELEGQELIGAVVNDDKTEIHFWTKTGKRYLMYHDQDCCEQVSIEDICGDIQDLTDTKIIDAYESANYENGPGTWTFYNIQSEKGSITIRWYGESNGYYSESVEFVEITED